MLPKKALRLAPNNDSADLRVKALEAAMMGRRRGDQASLFYEFRLDDRIPKDHLPKYGLIPEFVGRLPVIATLRISTRARSSLF